MKLGKNLQLNLVAREILIFTWNNGQEFFSTLYRILSKIRTEINLFSKDGIRLDHYAIPSPPPQL